MSVEAAGVSGWRKYAHAPFGLQNCFGLSAPGDALYKHFGFTPANLAQKGKEVIAFYSVGGASKHPVAPSLMDYPHFHGPAPIHH